MTSLQARIFHSIIIPRAKTFCDVGMLLTGLLWPHWNKVHHCINLWNLEPHFVHQCSVQDSIQLFAQTTAVSHRPVKSHALGVRHTYLGSISRSHAQPYYSHAFLSWQESIHNPVNFNTTPSMGMWIYSALKVSIEFSAIYGLFNIIVAKYWISLELFVL